MPVYVLKTFNPSGQLIGRVEFRSMADDEAVVALRYLNETRFSELWCGSRLVTTWHGPTADMALGEHRRRPARPRFRSADGAENPPPEPPGRTV